MSTAIDLQPHDDDDLSTVVPAPSQAPEAGAARPATPDADEVGAATAEVTAMTGVDFVDGRSARPRQNQEQEQAVMGAADDAVQVHDESGELVRGLFLRFLNEL